MDFMFDFYSFITRHRDTIYAEHCSGSNQPSERIQSVQCHEYYNEALLVKEKRWQQRTSSDGRDLILYMVLFLSSFLFVY
jgi:hypothetical protein